MVLIRYSYKISNTFFVKSSCRLETWPHANPWVTWVWLMDSEKLTVWDTLWPLLTPLGIHESLLLRCLCNFFMEKSTYHRHFYHHVWVLHLIIYSMFFAKYPNSCIFRVIRTHRKLIFGDIFLAFIQRGLYIEYNCKWSDRGEWHAGKMLQVWFKPSLPVQGLALMERSLDRKTIPTSPERDLLLLK